ncbi:MAG TPA: hypothetical protein VF784_05325 [Anaerolineales bacterium]
MNRAQRGRRSLYQPVSGWEFESGRFKALLEKWLEYWLNHLFDLTIRGPEIRRYWITWLGVAFVIGGLVAHIVLYYVPILTSVRPFVIADVPLFLLLTVVRLVILLFIPAYMAITMAGNYLSDVFELKDPVVAWEYIGGLALGGARYTIHIRDGKISEESLNSPVLLIGGPGVVIAEFDSAALFEKPDGTPHVIGLASIVPESRAHSRVVLDGFERLREPIINLRDQYIGSAAGQPMTVVSRSQDGIPVSATDVRGMFSVRRQKVNDVTVSSIQAPYPFDPEDIEKLIYKQAVPVMTDELFASGQPGPWTATMQGLIRGALGEFMNQHKLAEYLAGTGSLESDLSEFREDTIVSTTLRYSNELPDATAQSGSKVRFHPRTELIERFMRPANGFALRARERGLELHWIGLGTWKMPNEISDELVNEQHLEAWRINRENAERSSPETTQSLSDEAYVNEKIRLIQAVPLEAHQKNLARYSVKDVLLECLLQDYWEQMGDALEAYYQGGPPPPELDTLEKSVLRLERLLKIQRGHVLGGGTLSKVRRTPDPDMSDDAPPAPSSKYEAEQYRQLLKALEGNTKVAEGMIANEARRHPDLDRSELIRRIVSRRERHEQ